MLSADASLDWRVVPAAAVTGGLREPPAGTPVAPGARVVELRYEGGAIGRRSRATLLVDPGTAAGIQRVQEDLGSRQRYREYRYTDIGAYHWTRWPEPGEERLPVSRWTRTSEGPRPYGIRPGGPVLEPTALVYAVAAAPLLRTGDRASFYVFQRRVLQEVEVAVVGRRTVAVDYVEEGANGKTRRRQKVEALRVVLRGDPDTAGGDDELELLGLRGNPEICLDPVTRAPLEISGNVAIIGQVTLRLKALRHAPPLAAERGRT